jgi:hypothetical protein
MKASLRALLKGLIDYAGLFPPAQLPLAEAIRNDAAYRSGPDAWMLGMFVCPAGKLQELTEFPPLTVVGRAVAKGETFSAVRLQDQEDMTALRIRRPYAIIGGYEIRISNELWHAKRRHALPPSERGPGSSGLLSSALLPSVFRGFVFCELDYGQGWAALVETLVPELVESPTFPIGLKIRCGGPTAASMPSTGDLAQALAACHKAGVPVKFTAGLHHPLRHFDKALGVKAHGFLNVFVAGVLCCARDLDAAALQLILEDEDATNFHFDDDALHWKDLHATTAEVTEARERAVISFGSCSFDEPREDLRALGLLD